MEGELELARQNRWPSARACGSASSMASTGIIALPGAGGLGHGAQGVAQLLLGLLVVRDQDDVATASQGRTLAVGMAHAGIRARQSSCWVRRMIRTPFMTWKAMVQDFHSQ